MAGGIIVGSTGVAARMAALSGKDGLRSRLTRWVLTGLALLFVGLFILMPVANVFAQAFANGPAAYRAVFASPAPPARPKIPLGTSSVERRRMLKAYNEAVAAQASAERTWSAIRMTLSCAALVVPLNMVFGLAAAWSIGKFRFRGRSLLISIIDLPFSVSPVVAGLIFVLLFGRIGFFGTWAQSFRWPDFTSISWRGFGESWFPLAVAWREGIIFTPLATAMASAFVTFPFIARTLIPLMEAQGTEEEEAARMMGASGWQMFWRVTLPNIKWGLLYGVILCTARAMGEFGAVSVVSGGTDANDTIPLRVQKLWEGYKNQSAFALASVLACLAVVTLVVKAFMDWRTGRPGERNEATE